MVFQLGLFWYWSNIILPNQVDDANYETNHNNWYRILLIATASYLILHELTPLYQKKLMYFNSAPAIFNFVVPVMVIYNVLTEDPKSANFWTV